MGRVDGCECRGVSEDVMKKLIILRGPSGSGKSTTAQLVRERLLGSGVEKVAISRKVW